MAMGLNRVEVIGNVGSEPEMRFMPNTGKPVTNFSVAYNHNYTKQDGEKVEETEWFKVVTWGKLAEICNQFIYSGQSVFVSGRVRLHEWKGKDGQTQSALEIQANQVIFLGKRAGTGDETEAVDELAPEDIPF